MFLLQAILNNKVTSIFLAVFTLGGCTGEELTGKPERSYITDLKTKAVSKNDYVEDNIRLAQFAKELKISYEVIDNRRSQECEPSLSDGACFLAALTLTLNKKFDYSKEKKSGGETKSDEKKGSSRWRLYFSHMSPIQKDYSDEFDISHVNGDLHYLEPTEKFSNWKDGAYRIEFRSSFWQLSEYDSPPNFYVVSENGKAFVVESTLAKIDAHSGLEVLSHVKEFTDLNKQFKRTLNDKSHWATAERLFEVNKTIEQAELDVSGRIIPKPLLMKAHTDQGHLDISTGLSIRRNPFSLDETNPAFQRLQRFGVPINTGKGVAVKFIKTDKISKVQGYRLTIEKSQITIISRSRSGAFYALQSLASLYTPGNLTLPLLTVEDEPRFDFRGLHLDVARNFRDKVFVIKLLDQMAAYKLNKLHLHLADDEGWRLEIPGLPELTQIGSRRCHDLNETTCLLPQLGSGPSSKNINNGFYSLDDYKEILQEARIREIEVIPSFDMPGHSRAAVISMKARYKKFQALGQDELAQEFLLSDPEDESEYRSVQFYSDNTLNVCREASYRFIEKVVDELADLHRSSGVPLKTYHIGADETPGAWKNSPACKIFMTKEKIAVDELSRYFIRRVSGFINSRGIQVAGWSDGLSKVNAKEMPQNTQVNAWTPLFWDGHKVAHSMANQGWQVILSLPDVTYFDFPYQADPKERGYYWGSRFTNTRQVFEFMPENLPLHAEIWNDRENNPMVLDDRAKPQVEDKKAYLPLQKGKRFAGIQGHLWSEMVRSEEIAEYLLFPRLIALAERAWHRPLWEPEYNYQGALYSQNTHYFSAQNIKRREQDWREFTNALAQKELTKLDIDGWLYRIPTVGAVVEAGMLRINSSFPGILLEYQIDNAPWLEYHFGDVGVKIPSGRELKVRAKNQIGTRHGRSLNVNQKMVTN